MAFSDVAANEVSFRHIDPVGRKIPRDLNRAEAVDIRAVNITVADHIPVDGAVCDDISKDFDLEILRIVIAVMRESN